jgi:hypothetical protein
MDTYRDWIPAGEDTGAVGKIFTDFVPPATPEVKPEVKTEEVVYKCDKCDFVAKSAFGLVAHKKKHEVKEVKEIK